ncbi:MAG: tetratricopeptide repeat protein [Desulfobacterales bacterium]|nr:tetratricopeptide repeat protein [Desulfobacterales bacterium]
MNKNLQGLRLRKGFCIRSIGVRKLFFAVCAKNNFRTPFVLLILLMLCGCAVKHWTPCEKHGKTYCRTSGIFRSQWDDYYELALSCMEGGCYQDALSALDEALKDAPKEERLKRTYGLHFIDYFPHREKGVIYFLTGQYDKARSELEQSVKEEPSDKAFFYLDRVRTIIMQRENLPVSTPVLAVHFPSAKFEDISEIWTKDDPIVVSGTAEDKQYISKITLAGKPVFMEGSKQHTEFEEKLKLEQGTHETDIIAHNLLEGKIKRKFIIHVDRAGPLIILKTFDPDIGLQGYVYDDSGEISLFADGKPVFIPKGKQVFFTAPVEPDTETITLVAVDKLGNRTTTVINKTIIAQNRYPPMFAQNTQNIVTDRQSGFSTGSIENREPEIILKGRPDHETVFTGRISVKGDVIGKNNITELAINNIPLPLADGHIISFNQSIALKQGENRVHIKTADQFGNTAEKEIIITRLVPEPFQLKNRYKIVVYPFKDRIEELGFIQRLFASDTDTTKQGLFQYFFIKSLVHRRRFQIIAKKRLKKILQKQKMKIENIKPAFINLPGSLPARAMLLWDCIKTNEGIEIAARLVNIETREIMTIDVFAVSEDSEALEDMAGKLAEKLHRKFPLVKEKIFRITENNCLVRSGKKTIMDWPFIFYREGEQKRNFVTNDILGADAGIIGYGVVSQLAQGEFGIKIDGKGNEIGIGDWVISQ